MSKVVNHGIQEKSADTLIVEKRLRETSEGDLVSYEELSNLLGRDVRKYCYGSIITARNTLIKESVFFDVVRGEGLVRLSQDEACHVKSATYIKRTRSAANAGIKNLKNIEYDKLSDEAKKKHLMSSAQLGAMALLSSGKAAKKIESKVDDSPMAIGETLRLFCD